MTKKIDSSLPLVIKKSDSFEEIGKHMTKEEVGILSFPMFQFSLSIEKALLRLRDMINYLNKIEFSSFRSEKK